MSPATLAAAQDLALQPHVLRDYALLADGERGALVGPRGEISWLCFPGWESPRSSRASSAARAPTS
jgi:hypothetical protein